MIIFMNLFRLYGKYIIAGAVVLAIVLGSYFWAYNKGYNASEAKNKLEYTEALASQQAKFIEDVKALNTKYQTVSTEYQEVLKLQEHTKEIIYETKIKEIAKPVYTQCLVPISGVQNLNDTAERLNAARSGKGSK